MHVAIKLPLHQTCPALQRLPCISVFPNLVSKVNLRGLFLYPPTHVFGLWRIIHMPCPPLIFFSRDKTAKTQRGCTPANSASTFSQAKCLSVCKAMCHSSARADTQEHRGQTCEWGAGTLSPLLPSPPLSSSPFSPQHTNSPFPLSSLSLMLSLSSLSLSLSSNWPSCPSAPPQFPQLSALPKLEAPQQYRSQVKRKNRLRSQWTSGAQ